MFTFCDVLIEVVLGNNRVFDKLPLPIEKLQFDEHILFELRMVLDQVTGVLVE
jgi:hypothetical protein